LWALWAWIESKPGVFNFSDYDRLVELADKNGLKVILSTIAEIQPYWIHREIPGGEMIDHMGRRVVSSNRGECHFGLTPGGCTDHPELWRRMTAFLAACANQYKGAAHVAGWDAWNETRWNVQSDGLVCFCEHTIASFHEWLKRKYGSLDALNAAWKRRYSAWDEVMPGKLPPRPYTEMMAFSHFITWRSDQLAIRRARVIKDIVGEVPVTIHGPSPCVLQGNFTSHPSVTALEQSYNHVLNRGNDWNMADGIDGIGCSNFPVWEKYDDALFAARVEYVRSAARGKRLWLSEVQGGRSCQGYNNGDDVRAAQQQRWVYNGIACGADTILFWCWRDEVFGKETTGFGIDGDDGYADERLAAMRETGRFVEEHKELLDSYKSDPASVGVLFSPQSYYLNYAQEGDALKTMRSIQGYCRALTRQVIPYRVIEEEHLGELDELKLLFLPRTMALDAHVSDRLIDWVRKGGLLVTEAECGAVDSAGLYRYPQDRALANATGVREVGRRYSKSPTIDFEIEGQFVSLKLSNWLTPHIPAGSTPRDVKGVQSFARNEHGDIVAEVALGKGRVLLCGAFLGDAYFNENYLDFERFIAAVVKRAGIVPPVRFVLPRNSTGPRPYIRTGLSGGKRLIFVLLPETCGKIDLLLEPALLKSREMKDLLGGDTIKLHEIPEGLACVVEPKKWHIAVLLGE
jgi:beta-galactosidase